MSKKCRSSKFLRVLGCLLGLGEVMGVGGQARHALSRGHVIMM